MKTPIRCKVVRILSDKELIIDAGSQLGVQEGMVFNVLGFLSVMDLEKEDLLETLEIVKVSVEVSVVGKKVAVARTFLQIESELKRAFVGSAFVPKIERMSADSTSQSDEWDRIVKVGDEAVLVMGDD